MAYKAARHRTECDVIMTSNYFRKFLTLSNQTSRYKLKCIRMYVIYLKHNVAKPVISGRVRYTNKMSLLPKLILQILCFQMIRFSRVFTALVACSWCLR